MSGEILFLAHRIPFPPDRGDKIRSHHVLQALAALAPVHVGCLYDDPADAAHVPWIEQLAASACVVPRAKSNARAGLEALWRGEPVSLAAFRDARLARWVREVLASGRIGAVYLFSGQMGQYLPPDWQGRVVADLVDVDSAKFEAFAADQGWPLRLIHAREGRLLAAFEEQLASRADATLLVSEAEAALLASRLSRPAHVLALRNGIDCTLFDPAAVAPHPQLAAAPGPQLVFTGQMDYAPNVAAVARFARDMLPALRLRHPDAAFHIVGRAPTAEVQRLAATPGVTVWGAVPDMRPFLAAADLVVAPLTIARGVQNKVLEAMAMARPVLLSPEAATGIDGRHGTHFMVCDDAANFVEQALALLEWPDDARRMGAAARRLVETTLSWPAMLAPLAGLLGLPQGARANAA